MNQAAQNLSDFKKAMKQYHKTLWEMRLIYYQIRVIIFFYTIFRIKYSKEDYQEYLKESKPKIIEHNNVIKNQIKSKIYVTYWKFMIKIRLFFK